MHIFKLKRITPRTCLWPLTGSLLISFGLSIGLTFRSNRHCYAGVCGELLFPLQARLHVVVWYCWLSISVTILALRAMNTSVRRFLERRVVHKNIPIVRKSLTVSGTMTVCWVLGLYGTLVGIWWLRLEAYFTGRGHSGGISQGNTQVAAVAMTGHLADVTMGMVLLPVSRNSALSSFFRLSASTTFTFHMIQAYVLFALVVAHGLIYASWVSIFNQSRRLLQFVFPVLNPTYFYGEVFPGRRDALGVWRASLVFSGLTTFSIMLVMFLTTFHIVRRKHFNLFYFTHLLSIIAIIIVCLHASTLFYCLAPGLLMWVLDWGMRVYELSGKVDGSLENIGNGWFCLSLPLPRRRLDGCACHSPLAHFNIHHSGSSIREIHPFTTITHLASQKMKTPSSTSEKLLISRSSDETIQIQFLFRKSKADTTYKPFLTIHPREEKSATEWTNKLASLVEGKSLQEQQGGNVGDTESQTPHRRKPYLSQTSLRLEGPYFTPANPNIYHTVICLCAGTGISGAIAIAAAFASQNSSASQPESSANTTTIWKRCVIIWSVRETDFINLPYFQDAYNNPGLEIRPHLTGFGQPRLDMEATIRRSMTPEGAKTWVYLSGPNAFIGLGERACRELGVEYYGARWS